MQFELVPHAVIKKPIKYFTEGYQVYTVCNCDDLDYYEGASLNLPDGMEYALKTYRGVPQDTTTIYLPFELRDLDQITNKIREILAIYNLTEQDLEWERRMDPDL